MTGHKNTVDLNSFDMQSLSILQQNFLIVYSYLRKLVQSPPDLPTPFSGKVFVLDPADIDGRIAEQTGAVQKNMFAIYSLTQATCSSIHPVLSGAQSPMPRVPRLMTFT